MGILAYMEIGYSQLDTVKLPCERMYRLAKDSFIANFELYSDISLFRDK